MCVLLLACVLSTAQPVLGLRQAEEAYASLSYELAPELNETLTKMKEEDDTPWAVHDHLPPKALAAEVASALKLADQSVDAAETAKKAKTYPEYEEPRWEELRFLEATAPNQCQIQLRSLAAKLTAECKKADFSYYRWLEIRQYTARGLKRMTCQQSVQDLFLQATALAFQVKESKKHPKSLRLAQSWQFLRVWFVPLATAEKDAILWAGFWAPEDGQKNHRASKQRLFQFADWIEQDTVHPNTMLGRIIQDHKELAACDKHSVIGQKIADTIWSAASWAFVYGMKEKEQGTVVALVNKAMDGDRPLRDSILSRFEMPTVGVAAWGMDGGGWSPQVVLIDLMATCRQTSRALRRQLYSALPSWHKKWEHWSMAEFGGRPARISWNCLDCGEGCDLDKKLAKEVRRLVEAKRRADKKCAEVMKAVDDGNFEAFHIDASIVDCLDYGADLSTALHWAAYRDREDAVQELLDHGADINRKNGDGKTPLIEAIESYARHAVEELLRRGADPNVKDDEGNTALNMVEYSDDEISESMVKLLRRYGAK